MTIPRVRSRMNSRMKARIEQAMHRIDSQAIQTAATGANLQVLLRELITASLSLSHAHIELSNQMREVLFVLRAMKDKSREVSGLRE